MKHREIVFRSTSQIAGARTVNQLSAFFFDVRKKKGLRISADPFSLMRKIGFVVVLMLGYLLAPVFSSKVLTSWGRCGMITPAFDVMVALGSWRDVRVV